MLTQETTSIRAQEEPKQALLPTHPQEEATLTPRQRRANNAGQRYYTRRIAGTTATQEQLDAAMEQKQRQWQRNHASLEWQLHFTKGWNAAILGDPTTGRDSEKEQQPKCIPEDPTTDSLILGGEDDDENNRVPHQTDALVLSTTDGPTYGEADAPIFGKDDDEDRRPKLGDDCEKDDEWGRQLPRVTFGPQDDRDGDWASAIKCGEPTTPIYGDSDAPLFGPEGGDRPGWGKAQLQILARGDSDAPVFGPKGGGTQGWSPLLSDEDDDDVKRFAPHEGDDDTWCRLIHLGPNGGGEPGWSWLLGPEDDRGGGWSLLLYTTSATPVFGPKDDGEAGFGPLFGPDGGTEPGWAALLCAILFAPEGGDGTGWSPILCVPVIFIGIVTQCPRLDPEDTDDEVGCHHRIKLGPEDGDETGWHHPIRRDVVAARGSKVTRHPSLIDDDDEDYRLKFVPHEMPDGDDWYRLECLTFGCAPLPRESGDDSWCKVPHPAFGPTGGDDETWRHFARFGPQGDDETWDLATTTFSDRAPSQPEVLRILQVCLPVVLPAFGPRDDEDEGFLRPHTLPLFGPENDDEPGELRPGLGDEREVDGDWSRRRIRSGKIIALYPSFDEEKGGDGEDYCPRFGGESDLDGEGFRPLFGDDDDQEEEKGGWHHRRFTAFGPLQRELIAC